MSLYPRRSGCRSTVRFDERRSCRTDAASVTAGTRHPRRDPGTVHEQQQLRGEAIGFFQLSRASEVGPAGGRSPAKPR